MSSPSSPSVFCSTPPIMYDYRLMDDKPKWDHFNLSYRLLTEFPEAAKEALENAFRSWEAVTNFTFTETDSNPDLKIGFYTGNHCPGEDFSGPGGKVKSC